MKRQHVLAQTGVLGEMLVQEYTQRTLDVQEQVFVHVLLTLLNSPSILTSKHIFVINLSNQGNLILV